VNKPGMRNGHSELAHLKIPVGIGEQAVFISYARELA